MNLLSDGFSYNPSSGLVISGNLLTFLFCLLGVSIVFGLFARPLRIQSEMSDVVLVGIGFIVVCISTAKTKFINGDVVTVAMLFNVVSVIFGKYLRYAGLNSEAVILGTSATVLVFNIVRNQFIMNDVYGWLQTLEVGSRLLRTFGY